jgi:hypothetical protein
VSKVRLWRPSDGDSLEINVKDLWKVKDRRKVIYLIKNGKKYYPELYGDKRLVFINTEIPEDRLGRLRYTRIKFTFKKSGSGNNNDYNQRAIDATNKLIDYYRVFSGAFWIHRITDADIMVYRYGESGISMQGLSQFKSDLSSSIVEQIQTNLKDPIPIPPFGILSLESKRAFQEGSYYLSIIHSVTSLESLVKFFIIAAKENISNSYIKKILHDVTLPDLLTNYLKPMLEENVLDNNLLQKLVEANRKRNDIMHEYDLEIMKQDAKNILEAIDAFSTILIQNLPDRESNDESPS